MSSSKPFSPRNGTTLRVLGIARISTDKQDERSLDDQEALLRSWLDKHVGGPYELVMISGTGSGERVDRKEFAETIDAIETGKYDLVIMEDLSRMCRRVHSIMICETCQDHGTRLITINDSIDTAADNWQVMAGFASMRHEMYNKDTSARIRRTHRNRFMLGGVIRDLPFGYHRPAGTKSDTEIQILPEVREIYDTIFTRLEQGATYSEIADLLNQSNVPTGTRAKSKRWSWYLVKSTVFNPILSGVRQHNNWISIRDNKTGRRKTKLAPPSELLERICPNLQIIERERWLRVTSLLKLRAHPRVQAQKNKPLPLSRPTKRTNWPGRFAICGVCGRNLHVANQYGDNAKMICSGAIDYRCWNTLECSREKLGRKLVEALLRAIESIPDYDDLLLTKVRAQLLARKSEKHNQLKLVQQKIEDGQRKIHRITDAIADSGIQGSLATKLRDLESEQTALLCEQGRIQSVPDDLPNLPPIVELKQRAREMIDALDFGDPELGRQMSLLVPKIEILPYQMFLKNAKFLRCHAIINLAGLFGPLPLSAIGSVAEVRTVINLFEIPNYIQLQPDIRRLHEGGMIYTEIAKTLTVCQHTIFNSLKYMKDCLSNGITDPYQLMTEPDKTSRHRNSRHRHLRFRFEPLPGFPTWLKA